MGDGTSTPAAIDQEAIAAAVSKSVAAAVGAAVSEALKTSNAPLIERLDKLQSSPPPETKPAGKGDKAEPITAEAMQKAIADAIAADRAGQQQGVARQSFAAAKLKGVPEIYHGKLGSDPAKWDTEAAAIRDAYKADLAAAGVKAPDLGGAPPSAQPAAGAIDRSKLSGFDLIGLAVKEQATKPVAPPPEKPAA